MAFGLTFLGRLVLVVCDTGLSLITAKQSLAFKNLVIELQHKRGIFVLLTTD
jgi:hypothetical protein